MIVSTVPQPPSTNGVQPTPTTMYSTIMNVTPEQATAWLANNTHNRTVRKFRVKKYALTMQRGQWQLSPEGIILSARGRVLQGQHRLLAIVMSGCTVAFTVTFNAPEGLYAVLDDTAPRDMKDRVGTGAVQQRVLNSMLTGLKGNKAQMLEGWTNDDVDSYYRAHAMAIDWAISITDTRSNGLRRPQLAAVLARASYTVDRPTLEKFADIIINGAVNLTLIRAGDRSALHLRDMILKMRPNSGNSSTIRLYGCIERVLKAYIQNKEIKSKIQPVQVEQFALPNVDVQ